MNAPVTSAEFKKQHLIDPEICIRCNTCEATCPVGAVTHNDANYVVDAEKCNYCMDCIAPCPTGSIDNWRVVKTVYSIDDQFTWSELPTQDDLGESASDAVQALEADIETLLATAHAGMGGKPVAPASASEPSVNLFRRDKPALATVQGNFRITAEDTESDVRHIVLGLAIRSFRCSRASRSASSRQAHVLTGARTMFASTRSRRRAMVKNATPIMLA